MREELKEQLPVIVIVTVIGLAAGVFAFTRLHAAIPQLDYGTFSTISLLAPCVIMFVCSFVAIVTARTIGSQLYGAVVAICVVAGIASMVAVNIWTSDSTLVAALLANSEAGTEIMPLLNSPMLVIRDVAAFVVVPTVASILGAWVGSRLHTMRSTRPGKR